jgi:hypothetical protein
MAGWKGFLPAGKVNVPCRLEGIYLASHLKKTEVSNQWLRAQLKVK